MAAHLALLAENGATVTVYGEVANSIQGAPVPLYKRPRFMTRDPFGTIAEIEAARKLIAAKTELLVVEGAGHDLGFKGKSKQEHLPSAVLTKFQRFFGER